MNQSRLSTQSGISIEEILQHLEQAENQSGLFESQVRKPQIIIPKTNRKAYFCNSWETMKYYMRIVTDWKRYGRIALKKYPWNSVYTLNPPMGKTNSFAREGRIKRNAIFIYPNLNLVCKIYYRNHQSCAREVKAVKEAEKLNLFKVPKVVLEPFNLSFNNFSVAWFELEDLKNHETNDSVRAIKFLESLFQWYQAHGVNLIQASQFKSIDEKLLSINWNHDELQLILKLIEKLSKLFIPSSWIHGDPSLVNCSINKKGEIIIYDWELSRENYIVIDFYFMRTKRGIEIPGLKEKFQKWQLDYFNNNHQVMSLNSQLLLLQLSKQYKKLRKESDQSNNTLIKNYKNIINIAEKILNNNK